MGGRGAGKAGGRSGEIVRDGRIEVHPDPIGARIGDAVGRRENNGGRDEDTAASALVDTVVVQRHEPDVRVPIAVAVAVGDGPSDAGDEQHRRQGHERNANRLLHRPSPAS